MTPCKPANPTHECERCARHNTGIPDSPQLRQFVLIDATVVKKPGLPCPLKVAR